MRTITEDDLKKFTGPVDRIDLSKVYRRGGIAIATDAHVAVMCSMQGPDTEDPGQVFGKIIEIYAKAWNGIEESDSEWQPLEIGEAKRESCKECGGTGEAIKCPSCEGTGEVSIDHGYFHKGKFCSDSYDVECQLCDGSGRLEAGNGKCPECLGEGSIEDLDWVDAVGSRFGGKLVRRLSHLSPVLIHTRHDRAPLGAHPIRGNGWTGIIMPMRKESA